MDMKPQLLLIIFSLLSVFPAKAENVENLYQAEVTVKNTTDQEKKRGIKKALSIVLNRILTGSHTKDNKTYKRVLNHSNHYVKEAQFALNSLDKNNAQGPRLLRVLFNEQLIINEFRNSPLSFWNEIRPKTLIWLVIDKSGRKVFFDPETMPEIEAALNFAAKHKALPILFPIRDLDEQKLTVSHVLSPYSTELLSISKRYDVVSTLAGKLINKGSCWHAEWTYYFNEHIHQWLSPCNSLQKVSINGLEGVYHRISAFYAAKSDKRAVESIILKFSNIHEKNSFNQVNQFLESLPMAKTVTWLDKDQKYHRYRLFYQGKRELLNQALIQSYLFRIEDYADLQKSEMRYRYINR